MRLSDLTSGGLVLVFALLSLSSRAVFRLWAPWANAVVGLWLLFAPLVFWARAADYTNDTLVGTLVIVFAVLAPGMPGMRMLPGPTRLRDGRTTRPAGRSVPRSSRWRRWDSSSPAT